METNHVIFHQISDWNDAYANAPNIPGGERWPAAWVQPAQAYRDALHGSGRATLDISYGERARNRTVAVEVTPIERILEGARQELLVASGARTG